MCCLFGARVLKNWPKICAFCDWGLAVRLKKLPDLHDIEALASCQTVVLDSCTGVKNHNCLRDCKDVTITGVYCMTADDLESVPRLSLCVPADQPIMQKRHQHKNLTLGFLKDFMFRPNFGMVETLSLYKCRNLHFEQKSLGQTKHLCISNCQQFHGLELLTHLESLTFEAENGMRDIDLCIGLGQTTHLIITIKSCNNFHHFFSHTRRLTLIGHDRYECMASIDWTEFSLDNVEMLSLEIFASTIASFRSLEQLVAKRVQSTTRPLFKLFFNGVLVRDLPRLAATRAQIKDVNIRGREHVKPRSASIGYTCDGKTWISCQTDLGYLNKGSIHTQSNYENMHVEEACFARKSETKNNNRLDGIEQQVQLLFGDGSIVSLDRAVAVGSNLIWEMIQEQDSPIVQIPLYKLPDTQLFSFCVRFLEAIQSGDISDTELIAKPLRLESWQNTLTTVEYVWLQDVWESKQMVQLLLMADYLGIVPMCELLKVFVASLIRGNTAKQLQKIFNMPSTEVAFQFFPEKLKEIQSAIEGINENSLDFVIRR